MQRSFSHALSALSSPPSEKAASDGFAVSPPPVSAKPKRLAAAAGCARRRAVPLWKRAFDLLFIVVTCVVWLPLMLLLMAAVRVLSPGPIFYRQARVGFRGRVFTIYKFRSMKVNVETRTHEDYLARLIGRECPMTKLDAAGDPRLIPLGRLLRASGLDELPQIFNVLRGEMSLIGPRPCTVKELERYQPWQRERLLAVPGLTGLWQVNGKNKTTFTEMITLDIRYARHLSLWGDLVILAKTPLSIISQLVELWRPLMEPQIGAGIAETTLPARNEETSGSF
jgi:lipopolysaccharide/colanic/teichoic acid biosynthesis glycosyltransferase